MPMVTAQKPISVTAHPVNKNKIVLCQKILHKKTLNKITFLMGSAISELQAPKGRNFFHQNYQHFLSVNQTIISNPYYFS